MTDNQNSNATVLEPPQPKFTQNEINNTPPPSITKPGKFSLKLIFGIIIFLLLASGAAASFSVFKPQVMEFVSKPTPTPRTVTPSPTTNPTSNWKTYANTIYHFSVKYPEKYTMKKCGGESTAKSNDTQGYADGTERECIYLSSNNPTEQPPIQFEIQNESFEPIVAREKANKGQYITVDGKQAYINVHEKSKNDSIRKKNLFVKITASKTLWIMGDYDMPDKIKLFDQVISTLQFITSNSSTTTTPILRRTCESSSECEPDEKCIAAGPAVTADTPKTCWKQNEPIPL